jgi:2-C-methyl-D-erythritol 4-phosphate cytidylyltransferase
LLPGKWVSYWERLVKKFRFTVPHRILRGGKERFHSVKNGLQHVPDGTLVAIHDGVRPLVSAETIRRCFSMAKKKGNAIPVVEIPESIRQLEWKDGRMEGWKDGGNKSMPADRTKFRLVQTPQVFSSAMIKEAYRQKYNPEFTDDASVLESKGHPIYLVEGNPENIKITNNVHLKLAEALFAENRKI